MCYGVSMGLCGSFVREDLTLCFVLLIVNIMMRSSPACLRKKKHFSIPNMVSVHIVDFWCITSDSYFDFYSGQERLLVEELATLKKAQNISVPGEVESFFLSYCS